MHTLPAAPTIMTSARSLAAPAGCARTDTEQPTSPLASLSCEKCLLSVHHSSAGTVTDCRTGQDETPRARYATQNVIVESSTGKNNAPGAPSTGGYSVQGVLHAVSDVSFTLTDVIFAAQTPDKMRYRNQTLNNLPNPVPTGYARLASVYPDLPPPPLQSITGSVEPSATASCDAECSILTIGARVDLEEERRHNDPFYRNRPEDYSGGIMMAAMRLREAANARKKAKSSSWIKHVEHVGAPPGVQEHGASANATRPVIVWTDSSVCWRATAYSLLPPLPGEPLHDEEERIRNAYSNMGYGSTAARSGRACSNSAGAPGSASAAVRRRASDLSLGAEELYNKYWVEFKRRAAARASLSHHLSPKWSTLHACPSSGVADMHKNVRGHYSGDPGAHPDSPDHLGRGAGIDTPVDTGEGDRNQEQQDGVSDMTENCTRRRRKVYLFWSQRTRSQLGYSVSDRPGTLELQIRSTPLPHP